MTLNDLPLLPEELRRMLYSRLPDERKRGMRLVAEWVVRTCLTLGSEIHTAYTSAGVFVKGLAREEDQRPKTLPMSAQKQALIEFLRQHGPANRREMAKGINVPLSVLRDLLKGEDLFIEENGKYRLW